MQLVWNTKQTLEYRQQVKSEVREVWNVLRRLVVTGGAMWICYIVTKAMKVVTERGVECVTKDER